VRFRFKTRRLELLYTQRKGAHKYPAGVVAAFFEVMAIIESASDQRELRAFKSLASSSSRAPAAASARCASMTNTA